MAHVSALTVRVMSKLYMDKPHWESVAAHLVTSSTHYGIIGIIPPLFGRKIVYSNLTLFSCDSLHISSPVPRKKMQQTLLFMMALNSRN